MSSAGKITYILLTPPHGALPKGGVTSLNRGGFLATGSGSRTNDYPRMLKAHTHASEKKKKYFKFYERGFADVSHIRPVVH
jgi:hypothetical protein